ncbi:MAG: nitrilase-related carbon-nitrogen hydrolase, partial [Planctomycetota bacterium]
MKIAIAQVNTTTGDVEGNLRKVRGGIARARDAGADLAVFPELTLSGWMPGDLLRERQLIAASESALEEMADASRDVALLVGHAARGEQGRFISAACLFVNGECAGLFAGPALHSRDAWTFPGSAGCSSSVGTGRLGGETIGVLVGDPAPVHVERSALDDARVLIAICALPFHKGCAAERSHLWRGLARKLELPLVLVNLVGGNGTLVFDGGSIVLDARGGVAAAAAMFKEDLLVVDLDDMHAEDEQEASGETARLYEALTLGLADFVRKSGFSEVVVALSGGVDSAVTSSLAVDALGPERVTALGMPSAYSTDATRESARTIAENLGIRYHVMPIEEIRRAIEGELEPLFGGAEADLAKQNVQARI